MCMDVYKYVCVCLGVYISLILSHNMKQIYRDFPMCEAFLLL